MACLFRVTVWLVWRNRSLLCYDSKMSMHEFSGVSPGLSVSGHVVLTSYDEINGTGRESYFWVWLGQGERVDINQSVCVNKQGGGDSRRGVEDRSALCAASLPYSLSPLCNPLATSRHVESVVEWNDGVTHAWRRYWCCLIGCEV